MLKRLIAAAALACALVAPAQAMDTSSLSKAEILQMKSLAKSIIVYDGACKKNGYPQVKPSWLATMKEIDRERPDLDKEALLDSIQLLSRAPGGDACPGMMLFFRKAGYVD